MRDVFAFLKELEWKIEPPNGHHHTLRYGSIGSDGHGWEYLLVLTIVGHNGSQNYLIRQADMDKTVAELISDIVTLERQSMAQQRELEAAQEAE
jgi:hypothetical protein